MAKILFIDDDEPTLQLLARLAQFLDHDAITSKSVDDGLTLAAQEQPDLVFVDMQMSGLDGAQFTQRLRGNPATSHIPCVILSADRTKEEVSSAKAAGANGFFLKPVSTDEITRVIKHFTEKIKKD
jgi:two-component system cell cycle response regulator DivK